MGLRQKGLEKWLRKTSRSHPVMPVRDNLFPLIFFIFPTLFIVLLLPAIFQLKDAFG